MNKQSLGLKLSVSEDRGTARAVGERDSGRHLDDTSERTKAVSDLYTPFWNYAAEVWRVTWLDLRSQ